MKNKTLIILLIILIGVFSRIIPHPPNFTAIGAVSILGGLYFNKKYLAFLIPITAMFLSDFILGYKPVISVYIAFLIIIPIGTRIKENLTHFSIFEASVYASILFFLITNFTSWLYNPMYPQNFSGLIISYTAGIPFLINTLLGNLFFCFSLFGLYELISKRKFIYINS
tara:strand:+ start:1358 stop:1864 length:507 start_codon:yes stop_codon:yes gene_type:complete